MGIGLLFGSQQPESGPSQPRSCGTATGKGKGKSRGRQIKSSIPNPYSRSSSESEDEEDIEPDLEQVEEMRRSLRNTPARSTGKKEPMSERAKKGWLAHQSIFPPSSSSSSETDESEKETEEDSDADERAGMMGGSRRVKPRAKAKSRQEEMDDEDEDEVDGYILSPSELQEDTRRLPGNYLEEPLLGPDELDRVRAGNGKVPIRLQVYNGRFGHWEREGLRKYKDSGFLALWLTSIMGVLIGLLFVWGSTDVSHFLAQQGYS
jgi:hypothetical protein